VAFFAKGRLYKVDLERGTPIPLADSPSPMGGTWRDDDVIVFTPTWNGGLYEINANGGKAQPLLQPDKKAEYAFTWPHVLPDDRELLFATWGTALSISRLTLPGHERTVVVPDLWTSAVYATSGHVLVGNGAGQVQAITYRKDGSVGRGSPTTVIEKVQWSGGPGSGEFAFSVSLNGTLVYAPADIGRRSLVFVDQTGHATPVTAEYHAYSRISLAPDGRRAAVGYDGNTWIVDLERGGTTPLVSESLRGTSGIGWPVWSPDGSHVVFATNRDGNWELYSKLVSGSGSPEVVLKKEADQFPLAIARDGTLIFRDVQPTVGTNLWVKPPGGAPSPRHTANGESLAARISADGRLVAYSSDESGQTEIYVQPLHESSERVQVSVDGGTDPEWSPRQPRVFYRHGNSMMAVDVTESSHFVVGEPKKLFDTGWELGTTRDNGQGGSFAVLPDGQRFLMVRYEPAAIPTGINVILNWFEDLKRLVPTK